LLILFKLRTGLTEIALKIADVGLSQHFFGQVEIMSILAVESNGIMPLTIAK